MIEKKEVNISYIAVRVKWRTSLIPLGYITYVFMGITRSRPSQHPRKTVMKSDLVISGFSLVTRIYITPNGKNTPTSNFAGSMTSQSHGRGNSIM